MTGRLEKELYGKNAADYKITLMEIGFGFQDDSDDCFDDGYHYPISNETYRNALGVLESLKGLDRYLGVCGGGTQNLYLLGKLMKRNGIKDMRLIDKDITQLYNFHTLADIYNKSGSDREYSDAIARHVKELGHYSPRLLDEHLSYATNRERPVLNRDITVSLENCCIENYLSGVKTRGKYFIYMSNVLFHWSSTEESHKILDIIKSNDSFEDGSVVFMVYMPGNDALVLRKRGGRLELPGRKITCRYLYDRVKGKA